MRQSWQALPPGPSRRYRDRPATGAVFISLTKHKERPFGSILKLVEEGNDAAAEEFTASTFLAGGRENGFACPDNLVFDPRGNLWMCTDISSDALNQPPYVPFKNNGLFHIPMTGIHAGIPVQVASGPAGCRVDRPHFQPGRAHAVPVCAASGGKLPFSGRIEQPLARRRQCNTQAECDHRFRPTAG